MQWQEGEALPMPVSWQGGRNMAGVSGIGQLGDWGVLEAGGLVSLGKQLAPDATPPSLPTYPLYHFGLVPAKELL